MKRAMSEEIRDAKRSYVVKQEGVTFGYDTYVSYASTNSSASTTVNQPLPGQPPLPPMPPPPGAVPPPPHVFVPSQVSPIQTWTHAPPPPWQWLTQQQASALSSQTVRDIASNFQRDMPLRGNFIRRERFNSGSMSSSSNSSSSNNRNNIYNQRNNFHRNKNNRRAQRFESPQGSGGGGGSAGGQFDQSYYGVAATATTLPGTIASLDWQRNNFSATLNEGIMSHMNPVNIPNLMNHLKSVNTNRRTDDDSEIKIVSEDVMMKKNKPRKPMSQSYPSRPWNREDAERALTIESEYNKTVKAQSLIIKFPDPDLNKDIVREFHPGIQNIHFQSPSGPRYCFIQMADNVNIDEAIKELEKVAFGVGHLKVERKSLRDDDNPMPEEIDPYTLYIGNLPESVNVNEVKSKFTTAARVDVGYAQKMRNTRYAFIRYNSVDESIAAYRQAHDLMWDTRSIIVRFRRQRGNTCLPGEQKNLKKIKEEAAATAAAAKLENSSNQNQDKQNAQKEDGLSLHKKYDSSSLSLTTATTTVAAAVATTTTILSEENGQKSPTSQSKVTMVSGISSPDVEEKEDITATTTLLTEIKEEPQDYEEMDMQIGNDDDDDDDDDDDETEEIEEDEEIDDHEEEDEEDDDDDDEEEEECLDDGSATGKSREEENLLVADVQSDHLDRMFSDLENIAGDISL